MYKISFNKEKKWVEVRFRYDPQTVLNVKQLPSRRWNPDAKFWYITDLSSTTIEEVIKFGKDNNIEVGNDVLELLLKEKREVERVKEVEEEVIASSTPIPHEHEIQGVLMPYQRVGVLYALKKQRCFIADAPGLGKTLQALTTLNASRAFPALIICPASLKYNWRNEVRKWLPHLTTSVFEGKYGEYDKDILICNYDILKNHAEKIVKDIKIQGLVIDESTFIKEYSTKRSQYTRKVAKGVPLRLALTGTPILNRPYEMISQLAVLSRLEELGGYKCFVDRYCNPISTRYGVDKRGSSNLGELHKKLKEVCFIRRKKEEVLKELPPKTRTILPIELSNKEEYDEAEKDFIKWLKEELEGQEDFKERLSSAKKAETLVKIGKLKKLAAEGKLGGFFEWAEDFLESGNKLVVFAWHQDIIDKLVENFKCGSITGSTSSIQRQEWVDDFQKNERSKVIVLNLQAGGMGFTLTAASHVALLEYPWSPSIVEQAEDRLHRKGQVNQVNAYHFAGMGSIDERLIAILTEKQKIIEAAIDGVEMSEEDSMLQQLLKNYSKKGI